MEILDYPAPLRIGAGFMIFPVPVLLQGSVQEIVPYTISRHVMEILNYPDKYWCQACVGSLTSPL